MTFSFAHWLDKQETKKSIIDYALYVIGENRHYLSIEEEQMIKDIARNYDRSVPV